MARKLRLVYPGALYHVVNRGNYRRGLYESVGAAKAFLGALEEAVKIYRWRLYAYALMSNHYHLVLETLEANLSEGMHWLQSTYGTRFNRFRNEQGHLFQGRYHAGLIEDWKVLSHVVDYVHLNPVKAKIVPADQADRYRWSSLGGFVRGPRMPGLSAAEWLASHGCEDTASGWEHYKAHLVELAGNLEEQERLGWKGFSYGWAIGSEGWKKRMAAEHAEHALNPGLERSVVRELQEARWQDALTDGLRKLGRGEEDLKTSRKGADWKVRLALTLRQDYATSYAWLAKALAMGSAGGLRNRLWHAKRQQI